MHSTANDYFYCSWSRTSLFYMLLHGVVQNTLIMKVVAQWKIQQKPMLNEKVFHYEFKQNALQSVQRKRWRKHIRSSLSKCSSVNELHKTQQAVWIMKTLYSTDNETPIWTLSALESKKIFMYGTTLCYGKSRLSYIYRQGLFSIPLITETLEANLHHNGLTELRR
jgi:hypothetical protein